MSGKLYIVATPIGNLSDMTERGWETLKNVDFIAAEDTRVSIKLLNYSGISKPIVSYFEHNKLERGRAIVSRLLSGESCALVSDAGTPAISDPGEDLCKLCAEEGIEVVPVPGACAAVAALCASGFPSGRFTFEGFLSVKKKSREEHLRSVADEQRTMIFYEAPHKLRATLKDMLEVFGDRNICLCRELTKIHEQFIRTTLSNAVEYYEKNNPKGEFVLIIQGADSALQEEKTNQAADAVQMVRGLIEEGINHSNAVKQVAAELGVSKSALYKDTLFIAGDNR